MKEPAYLKEEEQQEQSSGFALAVFIVGLLFIVGGLTWLIQ